MSSYSWIRSHNKKQVRKDQQSAKRAGKSYDFKKGIKDAIKSAKTTYHAQPGKTKKEKDSHKSSSSSSSNKSSIFNKSSSGKPTLKTTSYAEYAAKKGIKLQMNRPGENELTPFAASAQYSQRGGMSRNVPKAGAQEFVNRANTQPLRSGDRMPGPSIIEKAKGLITGAKKIAGEAGFNKYLTPGSIYEDTKRTLGPQGLLSVGGAREVGKGLIRGATRVTQGALEFGEAVSPASYFAKKNNPEKYAQGAQWRSDIFDKVRATFETKGTEEQQSLGKGFEFSSQAAPYMVGEGALLKGAESVVPGLLKSGVGRFAARRVADVISGQMLTPKNQMLGGNRAMQAVGDIGFGTAMDVAGVGAGGILNTTKKMISGELQPGLSMKDVSGGKSSKMFEAPEVYKETGDLTTTTLKKLEGKSTVSKQLISDLTNSGDMKQQERDIIRNVLNNYKEGEKVSVGKFAEDVKSELLPLKRRDIGDNFARGEMYESVALPDEVRGNVASYSEHIYESPIKNEAGDIHWRNTTEKYAGHTRVEDMLTHAGDEGMENTRRVIEVQSDLHQKGELEKQMKLDLDKNWRDYETPEEKKAMNKELAAIIQTPDEASKSYKTIGDIEDVVKARAKIKIDEKFAKLNQYNDPTIHFRLVREEVQTAIADNKTNLRFPTGDTAMKIEGLAAEEGENVWFNHEIHKQNLKAKFDDIVDSSLKESDVKVGMEVVNNRYQGGGQYKPWIITENLGGGKFKAIQDERLNSIVQRRIDAKLEYSEKKVSGLGSGALIEEGFLKRLESDEKRLIENYAESFDISGKVDDKDPVHIFYEKTLGKYLKNKFRAELITDENGVTWWDINLAKQEKGPVVAFRKSAEEVKFEAAASLSPERMKEAGDLNYQLFGDRNIGFLKEIIDPEDGGKALGIATDKWINLLDKDYKSLGTQWHESYHRFEMGFLSEIDLKKIKARSIEKFGDIGEQALREARADDFIKFMKDNQGAGSLKVFYERLLNRVKIFLGGGDELLKSYQDLFGGKAAKMNKSSEGILSPAFRKVNKDKDWVKDVDKNLKAFYSGKKERGFLKTIREAETETLPGLKKEVAKKQSYDKLNLKKLDEVAAKRVADGFDEAKSYVMNLDKKGLIESGGVEEAATAIHVMKYLQSSGKYQEAADIADIVAERMTEAGQLSNVAKLYENLSPEGVLIRVQKAIKKANKDKWFWQKEFKLTDDDARGLYEIARLRQLETDPAIKKELTGQLGKIMLQFSRSSIGQKLSLFQIEMQLLNPKTHIRNILGNELIYRVERAQKYMATPIDWTKSKITGGDRVITFKKGKGEYWKNFFIGAKDAWGGHAKLASQYDIPTQTFKSKYNPLYWGEKVLGFSLQGFDHAAYMRGYNNTIGELAYLKGMNEGLSGKALKEAASKYSVEVDANILKIADEYGKYITFQDDNAASKMFIGIKKAMNYPTGGEFGVGDLVLKYPKTPGALLMRSIEYSPAGFLKSAYAIAAPLLKGKAPNSREAMLALTRAITGTIGFSGMGYYLASKGILSGRPVKDKDARAAQKQEGLGGYQLNASALKRWVFSKFDDKAANKQEGDTMISYDWAQPVAMSVAMGANLYENLEQQQKIGPLDIMSTAAESALAATETLAEQSLLTGLKRLFGGSTLTEGVLTTIKGAPSSFTSSLLNQVNALMDNQTKETYDPNWFKEIKNTVYARIPFLAQTLPNRVGVEGDAVQRYQDGSNSLINVFINPSFVSEFKKVPEVEMVLDLYDKTGSKGQFPRILPETVKDDNGNTIKLSQAQYIEMQKYVGDRTKEWFTKLAGSPQFTEMEDGEKVKKLVGILTDIGMDAKRDILGIGPGSSKAADSFTKYLDLKDLTDKEFTDKIKEMKKAGGDQALMVDTINKYRDNDVAIELGLNTDEAWSNLKLGDKGNVIQGKIQYLDEDKKVEFFKSLIDRGIATDPLIRDIAKRRLINTDNLLRQDVGSGVKAQMLYEDIKSNSINFFEGEEGDVKDEKLKELIASTASQVEAAVRELDMSPREKETHYDAIINGLSDYRADDKARVLEVTTEDERWSQLNVNDRADILVDKVSKMNKNQSNELWTKMKEQELITEGVEKEFDYRWEKYKNNPDNKKEISLRMDDSIRRQDEALAIREKIDQGEALTEEENIILASYKDTSPTFDSPTGANVQLASTEAFSGFSSGIQIKEGTLAYKNNNPGNLRFVGQPGASQGTGGFAYFPTPEAGFQALINDIQFKQSGNSVNKVPDGPEAGQKLGPDTTLEGMIRIYAPTRDGNDPVGYAANVADKLGISPDTKISEIGASELAKYVAVHESGTQIGEHLASNPPNLNTAEDALIRQVASGAISEAQATQTVLQEFDSNVGLQVEGGELLASAAADLALVPPKVEYSNIGYIPPEYFDATSRIYGLIGMLKWMQSQWNVEAPSLASVNLI